MKILLNKESVVSQSTKEDLNAFAKVADNKVWFHQTEVYLGKLRQEIKSISVSYKGKNGGTLSRIDNYHTGNTPVKDDKSNGSCRSFGELDGTHHSMSS